MNPIADPTDIRNWQRRPDGITTSSKLEPGDLARLAAIGVKHVINLATDDHPEALADEAKLLADARIAYTHIPVPFASPTHQDVATFEEALARADGPAHVHCIANYRVTAFFYLLDLKNGISKSEAHRRMAEVWDPLSSDDPRAAPWRKLLSSP